MRVLLTGASGFVGANLARRLLKENHEVHVPLRPGRKPWRLEGVMDQLNVHEADITDAPSIERAVQASKPEVVMHLATYGAYPTVQTDMDKILATNLMGTINLVRACQKVKYECFINTSSSSEYGQASGKMAEDDFPKPINYYGATKVGATVFCQTHTRLTGAPIITTRLFSIYGPYEEPMRLVPSTIKECLTCGKLEFTAGEQGRDFLFTADLEDAYLELMKRPELKGEIINLGTGKQSTVKQMVEEIVRQSGCKAVPKFGALPTRTNETFHWEADTSKAQRLLKWRARNDLASGVKKTVDWMKENLQYY